MTLSRYIDRHASDLVSRLRRLVGIPTINPPGERYAEITALLARDLTALGFRTRRYRATPTVGEVPPSKPRFNVVGRLDSPGARKTIHFNAHYDVVPASGSWRHGNPFSGAIENGWIYGRGSADMKGSIASLLLALRALKACAAPPRMNVEVSFTADEETDSALGAGWLVRRVPIRPDYAIVMEGGEGGRIGCGHNGVVWLEVTVHGRAAHGSRPQAGINALEKMAALVLALDEFKKLIARRKFKTPSGIVMRPTLNTGGVFACGEGAKVNTVPASASFTLDRRVLPNETVAAAERELRAFLAKAARRIPNCRITVAKISENFPYFSSPNNPFFAALAQSVRHIRGGKVTPSVSTGFNDAYFFAHFLDVPTLGYGPGGQHEHAVDERAGIPDLLATAKIYANLLTTFSG